MPPAEPLAVPAPSVVEVDDIGARGCPHATRGAARHGGDGACDAGGAPVALPIVRAPVTARDGAGRVPIPALPALPERGVGYSSGGRLACYNVGYFIAIYCVAVHLCVALQGVAHPVARTVFIASTWAWAGIAVGCSLFIVLGDPGVVRRSAA
eukprot:gene54136-60310_t